MVDHQGAPRHATTERGQAQPLLEVSGLSVSFGSGSLLRRQLVRAVDNVSFSLSSHETLGVVGESGCGKSTTARAVVRLNTPDAGRIVLDGTDLSGLSGRALRRARRDIQMVFQDPYSSLDPSMKVRDIIREPLDVSSNLSRTDRDARVVELLNDVGLSLLHADRYPHEFSGGQRQRVAIARSLALRPRIVICDEPVSALDVSTQNQIINLLEVLQAAHGLSYMFIAHDLAVVRHIAHRIAVMYMGRIVEIGPTERVYSKCAHPYTEALLSAVPLPNPKLARARRRSRIGTSAAPAEVSAISSGCVYRDRCAYAMDICADQVPRLTPVVGGGEVACHLESSGHGLNKSSL